MREARNQVASAWRPPLRRRPAATAEMAPLYETLGGRFGWALDSALAARLRCVASVRMHCVASVCIVCRSTT